MRRPFTNFALKTFAKLYPADKPLLLTGEGSAVRLAELLRASGHRRPLLVTERTLIGLGLLDPLLRAFEGLGCEVVVFDGIVPNPSYSVVRAGIQAGIDCDSVFVVGGGSALDAAKVIAAACATDKQVEDLVGILKVGGSPLPFYAVPTTSGTGSEATSAAVISEPETHQKKFVVDPKLVPIAAALDPSMLRSLPPHITAATGMDALTHAIEAYLSVNRFPDADVDARLAVRLLLENLPKVYRDGQDSGARERVAVASFLAGFAFNRAGLGYVHAISHQVSAHYNTPHGLANAVILPHVLRFNRDTSTHRLAELERAVGETDDGSPDALADRFIARIDALSRQLDIPRQLADLRDSDHDSIAKAARKEAGSSYAVPRIMNHRQCTAILTALTPAAA